MAKDFLQDHGVHFTDIDVSVDNVRRAEMVELTGQLGVPVIRIDEEGKEPIVMVGFDPNLLAKSAGIAA